MNHPRLPLSLVLVLAYLAALVAPLRTSWACADGTHCVMDQTKRFVCPGGACSTGASCCRLKHAAACKHGAFPSREPADPRNHVEAPDHCRFSIAAAPKILAAVEAFHLTFVMADALPVWTQTEFPLPAVTPTWQTPYTLRYRPPPILRSGPSRGPPTL